MKIYTKTGDDGETGLFGGPRVVKHHPRIAAYGDVDELNAVIGWARCESPPRETPEALARVQGQLFAVGAELASPNPPAMGTEMIGDKQIAFLEQTIDWHESGLAPLREFILPGGSRGAAALHMARTVCRRAERNVVALSQTPGEQVSPRIIIYMNRLSDLLFVLARTANAEAGRGDVPWEKEPL